jgi:flagellar hook assembly protein FlgD
VVFPFRLSAPSNVEIRVFDFLGRLVKRFLPQYYGAGTFDHTSGGPEWDGRDNAGRPVPTGVYYYEVSTNEYVEARRMVLVR